MSKKKPAAKPAAKQERVTDEELLTLIAQHRKQNPDAGQLGFITALRAAGKSCSGGRVRTLWAKAKSPAKPAAGRKPRAKVAAAA
jgi:hypothetical protein